MSGPVTFGELKANQERMLRDPEMNSDFSQLIDGRAVTAVELTDDELKAIAEGHPFSSASARAIVVNEPMAIAVAKKYETFVRHSKNPSNLCSFLDLASALRWLNPE